MKRCIFGAVLLLCLLAGCLTADSLASRGPERVEKAMGLAAQSAFQGNRQKTAALTDLARAAWEDSKKFQTLIRHEDLVQAVDLLFADLQALSGREAGWLYGDICLRLQVRARALSEQDLLRCLRTGQ